MRYLLLSCVLACGNSSAPTPSTPPPEPPAAPVAAAPDAPEVAPTPDAPEAPDANVPAPVACKTADDCWLDDKKQPIARPKQYRGKKLEACKDAERLPVCRDNVCAVEAYKC